MVWVGLIGDNIIRPYFYSQSVNGRTYLHVTDHYVMCALARYGQNYNGSILCQTLWWVQDDAPTHCSGVVKHNF